MLLIYGEYGRKAKSAARLHRERFPARQTSLKVVKRLRETGCVTSRPRIVGRKVQPEDVLAYALAHPRSSTKMLSENCCLSKSCIWTILSESPVQGLMLRDVTRGATL
ncbi:hypothetical protein AVEN_46179-1 [Araneus ventricosus]|uniref:DUF4817 domain-containing protein n=1 Tax=Araneus ventricosus TaxID=182803 RepID=A0A4Y2E9I8_ARAVE|nr:hypothetical protein AVEN_46179-1 [Araneus ventricosus]